MKQVSARTIAKIAQRRLVMDQARPMRGRPREADGERIERHMIRSEARLAVDGELWVSKYWFETDAYGAAVAGILGACRLGLASGSLGQGSEESTLKTIVDVLLRMDPDIHVEEWMK